MKKYYVALALIVSCQAGAAEQSFIIKPQKVATSSRDELKEKLGDVTKNLVKQTTNTIERVGHVLTDLSKKAKHEVQVMGPLGALHGHVATAQKTCATLLEKLVENDRIYKKVPKLQLTALITDIEAATMVFSAASKPAGLAVTTVVVHEKALAGAVKKLQAAPAVVTICHN